MDLGMVVAAVAGLGMVAAATVVLDLGMAGLVQRTESTLAC